MTIKSKRGHNVTPDEHKLVVVCQAVAGDLQEAVEVQIGVTYPRFNL